MDTIGERVKAIRKASRLNQEEFGKKIGIRKTAVSKIETGENTLTDQNCLLICREFNINEEWLRTGEGEMVVQSDTFSLDEFVRQHGGGQLEFEILKAYFELPETIRRTVMQHFKSYFEELHRTDAQEKSVTFLTYLGKIAAAGFAVDSFAALIEGTIEVLDTPATQQANYAIGVSGDSMEPEFFDGDIVLVKKTEHIRPGEVGIFQKGNEVYIKQCTETGLHSFNSVYPDMMPDEEIYCLGKVIGKAELPE